MPKIVVSAFLYNPRGQVLLQHRGDNPYTVFPSHWGLFGGDVEESESLEEAIDREIWEELEYHAKEKDLWLITPKSYATFYDFLVPIDVSLEQLKLNEGQDFGFFTPSEALEKLTLSDGSRAIIRTFEHYQNYQSLLQHLILFSSLFTS